MGSPGAKWRASGVLPDLAASRRLQTGLLLPARGSFAGPRGREVLLTLLQGLSSMTFQLSYKSAVLNEWTKHTPGPRGSVSPNACRRAPCRPQAQGVLGYGLPVIRRLWKLRLGSGGASRGSRGENRARAVRRTLHWPRQTWVWTRQDRRQLSSSLSSDSLLQGQELRSPEKEHWVVTRRSAKNAQQKITATEWVEVCSVKVLWLFRLYAMRQGINSSCCN